MKKNITTTELFETMGTFSEEVDRRFEQVDKRFKEVDRQFKEIRAEMVTKNDLFAVRDDICQEIGRVISMLTPMVYKEDRKLNALMERLMSKRVLARSDVKDLLDSHPLAP